MSVSCRVVDELGNDIVDASLATPTSNMTQLFFYEIGQDGSRINEVTDDSGYTDTGGPAYVDSLVLFEPDLLDSTYIPQAVGFELTSTNGNGDVIRNIVEIAFTNDCSVPSVISNGLQLGWLQVNVSGGKGFTYRRVELDHNDRVCLTLLYPYISRL
jgi:hypothetical protein